MNKKVLMILDDFFPPDPRVEREAIALIEDGYQVHLWAFTNDREIETSYKGIQLIYHKVTKWQIKTSAIAMEFPFYRIALKKGLQKVIDELIPDFIHIHDIRIASAVFSCEMKDSKLILDLHENRPEIMKFYPHVKKIPGKYLIRPKLWSLKEKEFVEKSNAVIAVTEEARLEYGKLNKHSFVVSNSIDSQSFRSYPIDESITKKFKGFFNLLYIGDLGRRRGIEDCIRVIEKVKNNIPNIKLILVGDSSEVPLYKTLVHELGLEKFVEFEGFQDQSLLPSYITIADVGICPLWRNAHHDTTYANKLFQYMTLGLPQIVSDCPAQATLIKETGSGLVFKSEDIEAFSDCIIQMTNDELRGEFTSSSLKAVSQKWDWSIQKESLLKLYSSI